MIRIILFLSVLLIPIMGMGQAEVGETEITKWANDKRAAVSITYDDGTLNQFRIALPIMERLDMRGTFYINTGEIPGSAYPAKYIGRDPKVIIEETASIPTNEENLFERASLIRFLDMEGAVSIHDRCGAAFEQGRVAEASNILDEGFATARSLNVSALKSPQIIDGPMIGWDEIRKYAENGHEFGVHTISHPRLAVLDETNMIYELEKCKEEILRELGREHLFSAEAPFGTEDERVMDYALEMFPALRNRMPEPYLEEINRSGSFDPKKDYRKPYVQWQRGPLSKTSPDLMRSWIDDIITRDDTWLVLVFHGIEGIGWEAIPEKTISDYFEYINSMKQDIWVATFADVTKYMRERMAASTTSNQLQHNLVIELQHNLDPDLYNLPLTLKTYVDDSWRKALVDQEGKKQPVEVKKDQNGSFIVYNAFPNKGLINLLPLHD